MGETMAVNVNFNYFGIIVNIVGESAIIVNDVIDHDPSDNPFYHGFPPEDIPDSVAYYQRQRHDFLIRRLRTDYQRGRWR